MASAPIILVPGFWLGAWAWDEVAETLRADGHDVTALTLPGLESKDADRSAITFGDHVDAIVNAIEAADRPVVLAVHSGAGFSGYAASDRVPERIAAMVYVDTAPGKGAADAEIEGADKHFIWDEIKEEENLEGLSEPQLATFRERAIAQPAGVLREGHDFTNDARLDIPSTVVATGYTAEAYQTYAKEHPEWAFLAGLPELRDVTWIDLPTSHWPMWSKPAELAKIIGDVATAAATPGDGRCGSRSTASTRVPADLAKIGATASADAFASQGMAAGRSQPAVPAPMKKSVPVPPLQSSLPAPPLKPSLPASPKRPSLPASPRRLSLPMPPRPVSLPIPPSSEIVARLPGQGVVPVLSVQAVVTVASAEGIHA